MARIPQVTRTITTTKATALCMDIENGEGCNITVIVPRTYKDEKKLLKAVEIALNNENIKPVHIVQTEVVQTLYGMSEQKFIENADILPERH